jgi:hypothetical protein
MPLLIGKKNSAQEPTYLCLYSRKMAIICLNTANANH